MNYQLTATKNGLYEVINKIKNIPLNENSILFINYEIREIEKVPSKKNLFLEKFKKNPIKLWEDPLLFQRNIRNEWK